MRLPERVTICEVGTRDGFQIEPDLIPTEQKVEVVNSLTAAGLERIEVTSFVHPKAVPQLADAEEVMRQGVAGPADVEEAFEDATRVAVADQIEAGLDVICDGELRRMRFVFEMYDRLSGLERTPPARRLGVPGYDRAPHFVATAAVSAPRGLGIVREYQQLRRLCSDRPLKIAFPGPMTFLGSIEPGEHYGRRREALLADLVAIVREEVVGLVAAGASFIQLDEPGFARPPEGLDRVAAAEAINAWLYTWAATDGDSHRRFAERR